MNRKLKEIPTFSSEDEEREFWSRRLHRIHRLVEGEGAISLAAKTDASNKLHLVARFVVAELTRLASKRGCFVQSLLKTHRVMQEERRGNSIDMAV